jgi:7,8-dihydropterin-6-yl-methyl-4-(beta-D-ribofuranosyl)aminobenzene 5'-phosphate synthase
VRLVVLADDGAAVPGLAAGRGLSVLVEAGGARILFDTGSDDAFLRNASALGIDLSGLDLLFLSHGHWDHGGGVPALLRAGLAPRVLLHGACHGRRRAVDPDGSHRDVGLPWGMELLARAGVEVAFAADCPSEILPGAWSTGGIAERSSFPFPPNLQREGEGGEWETDRFPDEQALVVESGGGVTVVTGCTHAGVDNLLAAVAETAPGRPVRALLGGLHLKGAPPERLDGAAESIGRNRVAVVYPNHCSGADGAEGLASRLGGLVRPGEAVAGFTLEVS